MKDKRKLIRVVVLAIIALALGSAFYTAWSNDHSPVQVGQKAPDFSLTTLTGEQVRLSDYEGKGVFINFWASWCAPCKEEMPDMEKQYQQMKDEGIEILAINFAQAEVVVSSFVNQMGLSFPILLDTDKAVSDRYGINPLPSSFFIDKDGIVVAKQEWMLTEQEIIDYLHQIKP